MQRIRGEIPDAIRVLPSLWPSLSTRTRTAILEAIARHHACRRRGYLRARVPESCRAADRVVAISDFTRADVVTRYGLPAEQVTVATPGAEHLPALARRSSDPPYLLSVSSGGRNKNVLGVVDAFAALVQRRPALRHRLRLIGTTPPDVVGHMRALPPGVGERVEVLTDIDDGRLAELLAGADALVFLSRFEGFGLPVVEAMHAATPVVTTRAGALPEAAGNAAILVDMSDLGAVTAALLRLVDDAAERARRGALGQAHARRFTWHGSAGVMGRVLDELASVDHEEPCDRLGVISTWGIDCGIASYSQALVRALVAEGTRVTVFGEHTEDPVIADTDWPAGVTVQRCWRRGAPLDALLSAVLDSGITTVHVQHQGALFPHGPTWTALLWALRGAGVATIVTVHELERGQSSPGWLMPDQLIVHTDLCRTYLHSDIGLTTPLTVIPIGIDVDTTHEEPARDATRVLSFGFLHPHKGFDDVVAALPALVARHPNVTYRVVGAPRQTAPDYGMRLRERASALGVGHALEVEERFLSEAELAAEIAAADVLVFPYRRTPLGSSASVGLALAGGKPVIASATPFFADLGDAVLHASNSGELGSLIDRVVSDGELRSTLSARARHLAQERRWDRIAQQHRAAYSATRESMAAARAQARSPWVSVHIVAKETDALGTAWYRSCLESLVGYPDELIVVDNGSAPETLDMVRELLPRFRRHQLIEAPGETHFQRLRNRAIEATSEAATHIHWVDTDEIFLPAQLPALRDALADPRMSRWATVLVHFMIDPRRVESRQVKWNVFRRGPDLRWHRGVHEVLEGVPEGRRCFAPVEHLHLGYCRPQWQTFLKWLRYAILEHGTADMYRVETIQGRRVPWLRGARTPDTILDERIPRLAPYHSAWPASCRPWLSAWERSGLSWAGWAGTQVDATCWHRWQARFARSCSWSATLDATIAELGLTEVRS